MTSQFRPSRAEPEFKMSSAASVDLSDIAGSWRKDAAFDRAIAAQDTVDEAMWS